MVTTTQELHHSTRNFLRVTRGYLGDEGPLIRDMIKWMQHIDRFDRKCNKALAVNPFFVADIINRTQKRVQVFLHSFNTTCLENL